MGERSLEEISGTASILSALGGRFAGVDIQYRRTVPEAWHGSWRLILHASKNERANYRITVYGSTLTEAADTLQARVAAEDCAFEKSISVETEV